MKSLPLLALIFGALFLSTSHAAETLRGSDSLAQQRENKLESTVMNTNLPLEKRVRALRKMLKDEMSNGYIERTFCIWDPLGKSGPIANTVEDQKLRALHYGLNLETTIYQNEAELISDFRNTDKCDAILVRGSAAIEFNRFVGTVEAVGSTPDVKHLQLLMQVVANPKMSSRMTNGKFTSLGMTTMGQTALYSSDSGLRSVLGLRGNNVIVDSTDPSMAVLAKALGATPSEEEILAGVQAFAEGQSKAMISPSIAYLIMGTGQQIPNLGIVEAPIAQSTIHMIGHAERFPDGLAQLIREDFLFKFESYVRVVKKELKIIPQSAWIETSSSDEIRLQSIYQKVRLTMRDQGYYDSAMLRLMRKIRCKFDPSLGECTNPKE